MFRYNHHVLEHKWLEYWAENPYLKTGFKACTVYLPTEDSTLGLENLRLVMLADFFGFCLSGGKAQVALIGWEKPVYGFELTTLSKHASCDFLLLPRDFTHLAPNICSPAKLLCGRFLDQTASEELLADFGLDALRVFFLAQGPPTRDYGLAWSSLASSYHFLQKVWALFQDLKMAAGGSMEDLLELETLVLERWQQQKPHTALAAIMGFLKGKTTLTVHEGEKLAKLLQPYAPFLAAELLALIATI